MTSSEIINGNIWLSYKQDLGQTSGNPLLLCMHHDAFPDETQARGEGITPVRIIWCFPGSWTSYGTEPYVVQE